ncbi:retropepsin-like aspartic protease family protein [Neptunicella sp. SCSIO 80796]|uniref:retropepsin-like aspartic protease family protein n=1 Tax=Neptunicella plasticusilytica TaxID=3117012 RepID=UPI003A4D6976
MSSTDHQKFGKGMFVLAWISALLLLSLWFDDLLDKQFNPNQQPQSLQTSDSIMVVLEQNRQGHYVASGTINRQPVTYLLDTGATQVSIPAHLASQLNLQSGYSQQVSTANGNIRVYSTRIDELTLGDIVLHDIPAHLNPAIDSDEILLGMSALRKLDFQQQNGALVLTQKTR